MEIAAIHLGEYLIRTRRYDRAENKLRAAVSQVSDKAKVEMQKLLDNIAYRRNGKEYLPASRENKEAYIKFMNSLGVPLEMPAYRKDSVPEKMSQADYPEFIIERNAGFRSFVAYDLETTGLSSAKDVIIEIGAVRVVDGEGLRLGFLCFCGLGSSRAGASGGGTACQQRRADKCAEWSENMLFHSSSPPFARFLCSCFVSMMCFTTSTMTTTTNISVDSAFISGEILRRVIE